MRNMDARVYEFYLSIAVPKKFSEASMDEVSKAAYSYKYPLMNGHVLDPLPPPPYGTPQWEPFHSCDELMVSACKCLAAHITLQLQGMGVTMGPGGFKVLDVRRNDRLLTTMGAYGGMWYRGTFDFAVVPHDVSIGDAGDHIRVGILYRGDSTVGSSIELLSALNLQDRNSTELQEVRHPDAIMALLAMAASSKTNGPCDLVVMDGRRLGLLRFTDAKRILIYNNLDRGKACFAISEALKEDSMFMDMSD